MQALKESKKTSTRQPGTRGSSEGTGVSPRVPDESTVILATSSEGTSTKPGVLIKEKSDDKEVDWIYSDEDDEKKNDVDDDKSINLEMTDDEFVHGDEQVNDNDYKEMTNAEVEESGKCDAKISDVAKADAEKIKEIKDNAKKAELPPTSSSLSVSLSFGDQFLKLSSDTSLVGNVKDTTNDEINSLLDITLSGDSEIRKIKKEQAEKQKMPKYTIKSTDKVTLKEYDQKSALYQTMHKNKSFNRNPTNHALYHALMEALIEDENAMDKGVADTVKNHKRQHDDDDDDDDEDPSAGPNQGKKTKRRRTKESESSKKPSTTKETPKGKAPSKGSKTVNTAGEDVVRDDDQPQDTSEPKTYKTPNQDWFKQPPRPPTPDPEWNKRQVVLDQPEQPWFNQMVSATKDPLTFNDLMATLIDFSKYVLNRLKIENLTQDLLLGPAYNLLKGTCTSSIELEYNFQECFNALTDKLDWNNPEGDRYPFDLSKPLPLQGRPGHLTVAVDYFFNNDLEYLKTSNSEKTYTTSITKIKAAPYEILGIEDMTHTLWSTIKHAFDKDAEKGIKHWGERRNLCVKKLHGYGHLEEVVVKRADRQLYKFKEGDFVDLHLNDIEDMLLLAVQHKLFHLNNSDIVDFIVALRMFTRSLIIKRIIRVISDAADRAVISSQTRHLKKVQDELISRNTRFSSRLTNGGCQRKSGRAMTRGDQAYVNLSISRCEKDGS
ncbi:hypothetical protein Tco_0521159 [Tanacetum coccineum]